MGSLDTAAYWRLRLAWALAREAEVILLDDPAPELGLPERQALQRQLQALAGLGHTVVQSLADRDLAWDYADNVIVLERGRLLAAGSPVQLCADVQGLRAS